MKYLRKLRKMAETNQKIAEELDDLSDRVNGRGSIYIPGIERALKEILDKYGVKSAKKIK
jgi:vacuolar-type H+-ATPase subunit D/Vma8